MKTVMMSKDIRALCCVNVCPILTVRISSHDQTSDEQIYCARLVRFSHTALHSHGACAAASTAHIAAAASEMERNSTCDK